MSNQGLFITLEGGDGAGKTTLMRRLGEFFEKEGFEVILTREPGGSPLGETIRGWLLDQSPNPAIATKAELLLFLAARAQHLDERIIPALKRGAIVICDRFNDSTVAYQSAGRGLEIDQVKQLCEFVCGEWQPSLTFFLDIDPKQGLQRTQHRTYGQGKPDRMEAESLEFHYKVRDAFLKLSEAESARIKRLDASRSPDEVYAEALSYVTQAVAERYAS